MELARLSHSATYQIRVLTLIGLEELVCHIQNGGLARRQLVQGAFICPPTKTRRTEWRALFSGERIAFAISKSREHKREIYKMAETAGFEPAIPFWSMLI